MARNPTQERIKRLQAHLKQENPVLAGCVESFQRLDKIHRKLGLMAADESLATQVSWWPAISILGTYSAGKSTFINQYVGHNLQRTGNQAVDDKFTVICFGTGDESASLPGLALDSDPRFPFYQISDAIEKVAEGEGRRVDSYLQLKTSQSEALRGKILIDSPGFDADQQRTSTLLITNHIINLSDLVLVFFDARHPEPGAMADTLSHLVENTIQRTDATKFLYVLNQIDNTAREDNPEEVVAAWQRALAQHGLTAGRFYRIYARDAATAITDEAVRERLERKRDEDIADIEARIQQVEVERAYRVVGVLENSARHLRDVLVPRLSQARRDWRRRTLWFSVPVFTALLGVFLWWSIAGDHWDGFYLDPFVALSIPVQIAVVAIASLLALLLHAKIRELAGKSVLRGLQRDDSLGQSGPALQRAFAWNVRAWWSSLASATPRGWGPWRRRRLDAILAQADDFVQSLNDNYARPSGSVNNSGR
ncbi:dynamin family protein [Seongchinamella sediminis]|uniref:dynamin family protein n=1 Tax=Seongchinamella sediminis TaxID=2283635 RepID=UPI00196865AF|nr:dynamin family protein [Seongchinamella sediminis]